MAEYTVVSDGTPPGTHVYIDGVEMENVKTVTLFAQAEDAVELIIEVPIARLEFIGREAKFEGLQDVPIEALVQELERRKDDK